MSAVTDRPAPHEGVDTAFLVNQAVLFDDRNGRVHELNPSASAVWLLLDGELSLDDVAVELHELLGVDRDVLRADIDLVVADFADRGLLAGTEPLGDGHDDHDHRGHGHVADAGRTVLAPPPDP